MLPQDLLKHDLIVGAQAGAKTDQINCYEVNCDIDIESTSLVRKYMFIVITQMASAMEPRLE